MSPPEAAIWLRIRQRVPGRPTFRRQHAIGPFILDFYCASRKLAVEVDGGGHFDQAQAEHDRRRTVWLNGRGVRVVRLLASDVLRDADEAAETIWRHARGDLASEDEVP
jgi:very-short-patch-repair endonuclease